MRSDDKALGHLNIWKPTILDALLPTKISQILDYFERRGVNDKQTNA